MSRGRRHRAIAAARACSVPSVCTRCGSFTLRQPRDAYLAASSQSTLCHVPPLFTHSLRLLWIRWFSTKKWLTPSSATMFSMPTR